MRSRVPYEIAAATVFLGLAGMLAWGVAAIPGMAEWARSALGFSFAPPPPSPGDVWRIFVANTKTLAIPLLASLPCTRVVRGPVTDVLVGVALAPSAAVIGLVLGAYGTRLAAWLPHLPLELLAISLVAGAYCRARHSRLTLGHLATASTVAVVALAGGACLEVYLTPHT